MQKLKLNLSKEEQIIFKFWTESGDTWETGSIRAKSIKKFRTFIIYGKLSYICPTKREIIGFSTPGVIAVDFVNRYKIVVKNIRGVNLFCVGTWISLLGTSVFDQGLVVLGL